MRVHAVASQPTECNVETIGKKDRRPTIAQIRSDVSRLDSAYGVLPSAEIVAYEDYSIDGSAMVKPIAPSRVIAALPDVLFIRTIAFACTLLFYARKNAILIANGGHHLGQIICILNYMLGRSKRRVLLFDLFPETESAFKRTLLRWMVLGSSLCIVFSRSQVRLQALYLGIPEERFLFIPYKANHSKDPPIDRRLGDYVFSGGNSKRDYATLFDAVRDTAIPVVISATDHGLLKGLHVPNNVVILSAVEPAFARLMAGGRFVVIPLTAGGVRGAGEASACNAMWHGKAVVCADDISAADHVIDGVTGYIVPSGDSRTLRSRILTLWEDSRATQEMGQRAHDHVASWLTHDHFVRRILTLCDLLSASAP